MLPQDRLRRSLCTYNQRTSQQQRRSFGDDSFQRMHCLLSIERNVNSNFWSAAASVTRRRFQSRTLTQIQSAAEVGALQIISVFRNVSKPKIDRLPNADPESDHRAEQLDRFQMMLRDQQDEF